MYALGSLILPAGTFVINHFDLSGLRDVGYATRSKSCPDLDFVEIFCYGLIRYPLMLGSIVAFQVTSWMTAGHLLFETASAACVLIAVEFMDERKLIVITVASYRSLRTPQALTDNCEAV